MKKYLNKIELIKTYRGVWELDPFKGCEHSKQNNGNGCYGICYATRLAKARGYDFSEVVKRDFISDKHFLEISKQLKKIPFVRLGVMCDPSFDWKHTLNIIERIKPFQKNIVIVTKHWNTLNNNQLTKLKGLIINTSICALDTEEQRVKRIYWYTKLKKYCKSILRVNTADFNDVNLQNIQNELLNNENVIDNILRFPKNHILVKTNIINVKKYKYLKSSIYASKHKEDIYFSFCDNCLDLCGVELFQKKLSNWLL